MKSPPGPSQADAGNNCFYCDEQLERQKPAHGALGPNARTVDHVIPKTNGGKDRANNRVFACHWCNNSKGSRTLEAWIRWLRKQDQEKLGRVGYRKKRKVIGRWMDGKIVAPVTNPT